MASNPIPQPRGRGKPKRSALDKHLFLRGQTWWTRFGEEKESTGLPLAEKAAAREVRDTRLRERQLRRAGVERLRPALSLGELARLYIDAESAPYDRARGGEQVGTKRSWKRDRSNLVRVFGRSEKKNKNGKVIARARRGHLDPNMSAGLVDAEALRDLCEKVQRETPTPKPATRANFFRFVRRLFSFAVENKRKTGIDRSPFADLTDAQRERLFPPTPTREFVFTPEQLKALYAALPAHAIPFVKFAVHTGARVAELLTLTWGAVDLEKGIVTIAPEFHKTGGSGKLRTLVLGTVAEDVLSKLRPKNPAPGDPVFLGRLGAPIKSIRGAFDSAVGEIWEPTRPGERRPVFHDLRATCGTRCAAIGGYAVAQRLLGHSSGGSVTDRYLRATDEDVRRALNAAAAAIDGTAPEAPEGAIPFRTRAGQGFKTEQKTEQSAEVAVS